MVSHEEDSERSQPVSLDAYDLCPLPRLRLLDQATSGSSRLSRIPFTLLDLFLIFLVVALGILAAFSLLVSNVTHPLPIHINPAISSAAKGPAFARPVVNTPARAIDPTAQSGTSGKPVAAPTTTVTPVDGLGDVGFYDYYTDTINKHIKLKVNIGDGNLVVETSDVSIRGTGIDLSLGGSYNSLGNSSAYGKGWTANLGSDVYLQPNSDGSITYFDPTGHQWTYLRNSSGGWKNPAGLDADLVCTPLVGLSSNGTPYTAEAFIKLVEVYNFNLVHTFLVK